MEFLLVSGFLAFPWCWQLQLVKYTRLSKYSRSKLDVWCDIVPLVLSDVISRLIQKNMLDESELGEQEQKLVAEILAKFSSKDILLKYINTMQMVAVVTRKDLPPTEETVSLVYASFFDGVNEIQS